MDGAMAERMVFPAAYAHVVPLASRAAALVEPTSVALHGVTRGNVAGRSVVVIGVGPIGLLAAQIARARGAADVLVSDTRADRLALAASLGFAPFAPVGEDGPDVAILCAGGPGAIAAAFSAVRPGGTVVALGLSGRAEIPFDWDGLVVRDIDLIGVLGSVGYWEGAIELIASGAVVTEPLVTQTFPLERAHDAIERLVDPGSLKVLVEPG
jgi:threonine dehydrogenase-like Zn-dependent dehydrogenase